MTVSAANNLPGFDSSNIGGEFGVAKDATLEHILATTDAAVLNLEQHAVVSTTPANMPPAPQIPSEDVRIAPSISDTDSAREHVDQAFGGEYEKIDFSEAA